MASRFIALILLGLYAAGLGLAAPLSTESALAFGSLLAERSVPVVETPSTNELSILPRIARVFRFDQSKILPEKKKKVSKYFFDATLGLTEASDIQIVPVFSGTKSKRIIVDTDGDVLTVTYGGNKFVPIWAKTWTSSGFRGALRFSQGLAMLILGSSLTLALACSYWRSLCPKGDQSEFSDLENAKAGTDSVNAADVKSAESLI